MFQISELSDFDEEFAASEICFDLCENLKQILEEDCYAIKFKNKVYLCFYRILSALA